MVTNNAVMPFDSRPPKTGCDKAGYRHVDIPLDDSVTLTASRLDPSLSGRTVTVRVNKRL